jgi:hypothetical protein
VCQVAPQSSLDRVSQNFSDQIGNIVGIVLDSSIPAVMNLPEQLGCVQHQQPQVSNGNPIDLPNSSVRH